MPQLEQLSLAKAGRIAALTARFYRGIQHDADVLGAVVRALAAPRGAARVDAEHFGEFVREIVRQELSA
jgi:hypothetical protein